MEQVFQTLSEQLRIGEHEIERRKVYMGIEADDVTRLKQVSQWIQPHMKGLIEAFYREQTAIPEIALKIGDSETLGNLHRSMHQYVLDLFSGEYDLAYVDKRLRIGKVHQRIGVSPKLYLSGINQLQLLLEDLLDIYADELAIDGRLVKQSMRKILYFDNQFVFDTYIAALQSEVETANVQLETYASSLEEKVALRTRELTELSLRDPLTNLYNQRAFYEQLENAVSVAQRMQSQLSVLYLDVNKFKEINDEHGHLAGDETLVSVADAIMSTARKTETAVRYGGDEFCIILPNTPIVNTPVFIKRFLEAFDRLCPYGVTLSIGGAAVNPELGYEIKDLVGRADKEMYQAKEIAHGSNKHEVCLNLAESEQQVQSVLSYQAS
ncbi:MAG: GGDEF domain-containing protein [Vibrio sp.]